MGFHRRRSVLGVVSGGSLHGRKGVYDAARIQERSRMIGYGIDARRQRFPQETPFVYLPHAQAGERYEWNESVRASIRDYNLMDLSI
jgi:hypothetical protein